MPRRLFALLTLFFGLVVGLPIRAAQSADQKALNNRDVIDLVKAGLSSEVILAKIKSSSSNFDTSPAALKELKSANVPDTVILAIVQAIGSAVNSSQDVSSSPHPTVDQILDKYVQAVGREAFQKRTTTHWKGTAERAGKTAELEIFEKAPNKSISVTNVPKEGEYREGFDGLVGWISSPSGIREKSQHEAAMSKWLSEFGWDPRKSNAIMSVKSDQTVGDRPTFVIEADLKENGLVRMYFDKETGLVLRRDVETNELQGRQTQSWYYEDFRDISGRKIAFVRRRASPPDLTIKFALVEDNVSIDDSKFARPTSGKVIPTDSIRAVAYRVIPQQNTTYFQSGTNSSYTSCYGSGQFSTFGNYGNLNMNTNCNTNYNSPTQIPVTWKFADVYVTVEDASHVYLIGCRANWRWSNCEPLIVGDVFPVEISGGTMTISALKGGKKAIRAKYNIMQISQK